MTKIFISYRRQDTQQIVGRIFDRLVAKFGQDAVFMDIDKIPWGVDFHDYISEQVARAATVLAVIGPQWIDARDEAGNRRLDNPDDFVRIEIEAALKRAIPMGAILIDGVPMPRADQLPETLRALCRRHASIVSSARDFHTHMDRLIADLERHLAPPPPPSAERTAQAQTSFASGLAHYNKGEYDRAIADYNEAIRLNPQYAVAYYNRGLAYHRKGEHDRAIADYNEAIRLNPQHADAYTNRGVAYDEKGEHDRAIADYNEAIRLNPQYADAYNNRGNAYAEKGEHDRAIADYNEAIRLNPQHANAYNNRGVAYHRKDEHDRAIADFDRALAIDPNVRNAANNKRKAEEKRAAQGKRR